MTRPARQKWKWTEVAEEILADSYGKFQPEAIAKILTEQTGNTFTAAAVVQYATQSMGLSEADNQGRLTLSEAARQVGVSPQTLTAWIKRQGLKVKGTRRYRHLYPETWEAVQAFYTVPPEPVMTLQEAADRLKRGTDWTYRRIGEGKLRAYKYGGDWRVSRADVERFYWDQIRPRPTPPSPPARPL